MRCRIRVRTAGGSRLSTVSDVIPVYFTLQGADEMVPIDSEGSGKWGLGGNEGVAPGVV